MDKAVKIPMPRQKILKGVRIWGPCYMMAGVSILSGGAGIQLGPISFIGIDKLGHFFVFGLLAIAWARSLNCRSVGQLWCYCLAVALTTGFGLLDEWHQLNNPDRYFEWADLGADFLGAAVFSGIYMKVPLFRKLMEHKFC